jgi:hypothetical protein
VIGGGLAYAIHAMTSLTESECRGPCRRESYI